MNRKHMLESLPRFAMGALPPAEAMAIARQLKSDPQLVEELLFTLELREALRAWEAPPPETILAPARLPLPEGLASATRKVRDALRLAGSGVRLLGKFI